jgi:hypothetical protein
MLKKRREEGVLKFRREKISAMALRTAQTKRVFEVDTQRVRARLMERAHSEYSSRLACMQLVEFLRQKGLGSCLRTL